MRRLPPSTETGEASEELLQGGAEDAGDRRSTLLRLALQYIIEESLEVKTRALLGRGYYERGEEPAGGYRSGSRRGRLKAAEGEVTYQSPQIRGTDGAALLCQGAVAELAKRLWEEYEAFATRDLTEVKPLYLFIDGIAEPLTPGFKREAVLCAWAITSEGRRVLLHITPGPRESTACCRKFIEEMRRRGLPAPRLMTTDGAAGLARALEDCFPAALRQRCLAHKMRNIAAKLPEDIRAEFRVAARASYHAPSPGHGPRPVR